MSTEFRACTDALGNAARLVATDWQAIGLLDGPAVGQAIAGIGYDSDENRVHCTENSIEIVIPGHPTRTDPTPFDEEQYEDRNKIEQSFNRMKRYRCLATHYEKSIVSPLHSGT